MDSCESNLLTQYSYYNLFVNPCEGPRIQTYESRQTRMARGER